jgi:hypothetical protein
VKCIQAEVKPGSSVNICVGVPEPAVIARSTSTVCVPDCSQPLQSTSAVMSAARRERTPLAPVDGNLSVGNIRLRKPMAPDCRIIHHLLAPLRLHLQVNAAAASQQELCEWARALRSGTATGAVYSARIMCVRCSAVKCAAGLGYGCPAGTCSQLSLCSLIAVVGA